MGPAEILGREVTRRPRVGGDHPRGVRARRDVHVTVRNVKATGARILAKTTKARGIKPAGAV